MTMLCGLALAFLSVAAASPTPGAPASRASIEPASPRPSTTGSPGRTAAASPAPVSSESPAVMPSASPSPSDVARWIHDLGAVRYGSFALSRAMNDFAEDGPGRLPPTIGTGNAGKTFDVCFEPYRPMSGCGYHIVVAARDVPSPPASVARSPEPAGQRAAGPLGLTYPQLLVRFHADETFATKSIVRDRAGAVVFISALDEDPPPSRYDHGPQTYFRQEYFFRDGVVAAYAYQVTMN